MAQPKYDIVTLNYVSLYYKEFKEAVAFYTAVFGEPDSVHEETIIHVLRINRPHFAPFLPRNCLFSFPFHYFLTNR